MPRADSSALAVRRVNGRLIAMYIYLSYLSIYLFCISHCNLIDLNVYISIFLEIVDAHILIIL